MKRIRLFIFILFASTALFGQDVNESDFEKLNRLKEWHLEFKDNCTRNWKSKWFLDGLRAEVTNTKDGMVFSAGSVDGDDACHAVLWTKDSFKGDIKIEYQYTRTDTRTKRVNILYIQATGTGIGPYSKDISEWNNLRIIPYMKTYYQNMNALHISYAAYGNDGPGHIDYIRARKYPVVPGQKFSTTTEIPPASFDTGLFVPGVSYKITVIKTNKKLYFKVEGQGVSKLFSWDITNFPPVTGGRVGLRHMYTRSAMYKGFKVYTK
ncbi:MAG: DUF1961 family protein [Chlorobi bacterium]|nr:DUF1961 family protein [Chlorobiota bacterium]